MNVKKNHFKYGLCQLLTGISDLFRVVQYRNIILGVKKGFRFMLSEFMFRLLKSYLYLQVLILYFPITIFLLKKNISARLLIC